MLIASFAIARPPEPVHVCIPLFEIDAPVPYVATTTYVTYDGIYPDYVYPPPRPIVRYHIAPPPPPPHRPFHYHRPPPPPKHPSRW